MTRKKGKPQPASKQEARYASWSATSPGDPAVPWLAPYRNLLSPTDLARLEETLVQPLPLAIRINPLKVDPATILTDWSSRYDWHFARVPFCPTGFLVSPGGPVPHPGEDSLSRLSVTPATQGPGSPAGIFRLFPSRSIEYRLGCFYIQDAASMLPVELFAAPTPPVNELPLILDLAAAPGGKTTHLVSRWKDCALVLANDSSAGRLPALCAALQDWGAINAAVTCFPGERFGTWFPETFDRVLLDAPCSMEHLRPGEPQPHRPISSRERQGLAQRQLRLLVSAFQALKTGGQLVYATCTLAPEEDEAVLDGLLRLYSGRVVVEDCSSHLNQPAPALSEYQGQTFDPSVQRAARLWPHLFNTSGFFTALLTKTGPVDVNLQTPPGRPFASSGFSPLAPREVSSLFGLFASAYGFDLESLLTEEHLSLWRRGAGVFALPETFLARIPGLPWISLGLPMGDETPDGFILSHAWAARFGSQFTQGGYSLPEELLPSWLAGEDLRGLPHPESSQKIAYIVKDAAGRNLGRGRFAGDRLRNLLPKK